jgi:hypothetical protein
MASLGNLKRFFADSFHSFELGMDFKLVKAN